MTNTLRKGGTPEYDRHGRMKYHPEFHKNHEKPFTESDLEYLCKFYDVDGAKLISLALGRTEATVRSKLSNLKKRGLFEYYKNLNKHWV
jgi:predicted ArsR family transcriptional regulator